MKTHTTKDYRPTHLCKREFGVPYDWHEVHMKQIREDDERNWRLTAVPQLPTHVQLAPPSMSVRMAGHMSAIFQGFTREIKGLVNI